MGLTREVEKIFQNLRLVEPRRGETREVVNFDFARPPRRFTTFSNQSSLMRRLILVGESVAEERPNGEEFIRILRLPRWARRLNVTTSLKSVFDYHATNFNYPTPLVQP